jgi:hypothetical protein
MPFHKGTSNKTRNRNIEEMMHAHPEMARTPQGRARIEAAGYHQQRASIAAKAHRQHHRAGKR